ncbi:MAG TPA: tetratricopeptide repeat protein [Polyangia bacterium]
MKRAERRPRRAGVLAFALALSAASAGPATAAPAEAGTSSSAASDSDAKRRARRSYEIAETHFKAGNYREALAEYKAGYEAAALPGFLINIAQCQRRLGDLAGALTTYRKFVLVAPDSPFVPQVQGMIQELEKVGPEVTDGDRTLAPALPAAAPLASPPAVLVGRSEAPAAEPPSRKTWWIVGGVAAAAVIGGTIAVLALRSGDSTTIVHEGTLGTLRR